jgi:hypothetical protein
MADFNPSDNNYLDKIQRAAIDCGREMQQCTSMCGRHNPTVVELKGIVEVGEIDDPANTPPANSATHGTKPSDSKTAANKAAVSFADEQASATSDLRARLKQQYQQLQVLQQKLASFRTATTSATTLASKSASDCRAPAGHNN